MTDIVTHRQGIQQKQEDIGTRALSVYMHRYRSNILKTKSCNGHTITLWLGNFVFMTELDLFIEELTAMFDIQLAEEVKNIWVSDIQYPTDYFFVNTIISAYL